MAAPSSAPISDGSCNSSARLPLSVASQPTVASRGNRSTGGLVVVGAKNFHAGQCRYRSSDRIPSANQQGQPEQAIDVRAPQFILPAG